MNDVAKTGNADGVATAAYWCANLTGVTRLPPLNAIRAFEAAGRLLGISAAARELNVTPAAISHQVRALENFLQVALVTRSSRVLTLTPEGAQYLKAITRHLQGIQRATEEVASSSSRVTVRVQAHATIAARWLIPRLSSFHSAHPEIQVRLTTTPQATDSVPSGDFDCWIQLGSGSWGTLQCYPLLRNEICPVCVPEYAARYFRNGTLDELSAATLLHSGGRADDWGRWLSAVEGPSLDVPHSMTYDSSLLAYQAALQGHGIAIAQTALVQDELEAGRLVLPFPTTLDMGEFTYYFIQPDRVGQKPALDLFRRWILTQATWGKVNQQMQGS